MPHEPARVLQLDLFLSDAQAYRDALARYETIRPVLRQERTLAQHSRITGLSYWRLWRDIQRFRWAGILGLIDQRTLPHPGGRPPIDIRLPQYIEQHIVRLAMAHPFTARELARIVRKCYHQPIDYRGIQRVLARHRLSPAALQRHCQAAQQASLPTPPPT
jgi:leucine-zipper of insertion element IS481